MSRAKADEEGEYEVGKGRPPKETRWKKGQSGNPRGRPKSRKPGPVDVAAVLETPVQVRVGSRKTKMSTFEASFRQLAKRAVDGHLPAIRKFLKTCEQYGVIAPQPPEVGGGVVVAPEGVDVKDWIDGVTELAPADEDRATSNRNASP
jgi:hypothetical protein